MKKLELPAGMASSTISAPRELLISIADIDGRFGVSAPAEFLAQLRDRYDSFLLPPDSRKECALSLALTFAEERESPDPTDEEMERPPRLDVTGDQIRLDRWDYQVTLHRKGALWSGAGACRASVYAFDSLLRILWATLLSRSEGGLFHACGLRWKDGGILFPGVSGAGKTTLARKLQNPDAVLSDEIVPLRRVSQGRWKIFASPFWGEFGKGGGSPEGLPLAAVGFLKQGDRLEILPVSTADAVQRLLETLLSFEQDVPAARRNLDVAIQLCSEVRCVEVGSLLQTPAADILQGSMP